MKADNTEAMARIQQSIDSIEKRMRVDSNDLDYETQRYAIRALERILAKANEKGDDD